MNLTVCLDISESMGYGDPPKIEQAKQVLRRVLGSLSRGSKVSLVTFDTEAQVRVKLASPGEVEDVLEGIRVKGVSCLSAGLKASLELACRSTDSILLLLTDGRANLSLDRMGGFEGSLKLEEEALRIASEARGRVRCYAVAVGEDAFTFTLKRIAEALDGYFYLLEEFRGLEAEPARSEVALKVAGLKVYSAPAELPAAQPTWTKESQVLHVAVASRSLYEEYRRFGVAVLRNPDNGREARIGLTPVDSDILEPYRRRRPRTAARVASGEAILVDSSYRSYLSVERGGEIEASILSVNR